jgi:uncharacterized cupin superfamily protein
MGRVSAIDDIPEAFIIDPEFVSLCKTEKIGDALGSERIYVNIDTVKPGGKSAKYHTHSLQEEFFVILSGSGLLRMDGQQLAVKAGDAVSKPAGQGIAHQFINNGTEPLRILDMGTREPEDIAEYPDEGVVLLRKQRAAFQLEGRLQGWSSDPNEG